MLQSSQCNLLPRMHQLVCLPDWLIATTLQSKIPLMFRASVLSQQLAVFLASPLPSELWGLDVPGQLLQDRCQEHIMVLGFLSFDFYDFNQISEFDGEAQKVTRTLLCTVFLPCVSPIKHYHCKRNVSTRALVSALADNSPC
jgi:hypothetical protein